MSLIGSIPPSTYETLRLIVSCCHFSDENGKRRRPSHLKILNPIQKYALGIVTADSAGNLVQMALDRLDSLR